MLRLGTRITPATTKLFKRTLYTVPEMPNFDLQKGIPGLLSPEGLDVAWTQYQTFLTNKLNQLTKELPECQGLSAYELMQASSDSPDLYEVHFYASQAFNNEFFFASLTDSKNSMAQVCPPTEFEQRQVDINDEVLNKIPIVASSKALEWLGGQVKDNFTSELSFRELFMNRASTMFGNGHTWLVATPLKALYCLNTYNHGNPIEAIDKQTASANRVNTRSAQTFATRKKDNEVDELVPLLNVSAWQHVYLTDYGVQGKSRFIENVYDCIDWKVVAKRAEPLVASKNHLMRG